MNILELQVHLDEIGAHPNGYSIGHDKDNRLVIMEVFGRKKWQVSFTERGECLDYKVFSDESQACDYFLQQLDPITFQPKIE